MRRHLLPLALLTPLVLAVTGCTPVDAAPAGSAPAGTRSPDAAAALAALAQLDRLAARPERATAPYRRDAFGRRWADVDRNGCGTRDDVLARDLRDVRRRGRCVVVAGTFTDFYTGAVARFEKEHAERVQVDHVVALAEAWRSGAAEWTDQQRLRFANDPAGLVLTSGPVNAGKSDQDAGTWAPADRARACAFAVKVVAVKTSHRLTVDARERSGLRGDLQACR